MEPENEPKHHIGYRILAYIYTVVFFGSLIYLLMICTKPYGWEDQALKGFFFLFVSTIALFILSIPVNNKEEDKNK